MKWLVMQLLGVIFVALIACSIQSISADHESGEGIFKDRTEVVLVTTENTNYQVYLQAVLRNGDGQLINVTENTKTGAHISHEIADHVFDTLMDEKEIVTVDNIKYEKIQNAFYHVGVQEFPFKTSYQDIRITWYLGFDENIDGHGSKRLPIFQAALSPVSLAEDDILTFHWTFLRVMN